MFVAYPEYVREKARSLRVEKHLSLDEIATRLALPKTTIYYWIRDLPLGRPRRENGHSGNHAVVRKHRLLREAAYTQGQAEFEEMTRDPTFRDFVCMYIGEGYKKPQRGGARQFGSTSGPSRVDLAPPLVT
jgi:hypothetical protein